MEGFSPSRLPAARILRAQQVAGRPASRIIPRPSRPAQLAARANGGKENRVAQVREQQAEGEPRKRENGAQFSHTGAAKKEHTSTMCCALTTCFFSFARALAAPPRGSCANQAGEREREKNTRTKEKKKMPAAIRLKKWAELNICQLEWASMKSEKRRCSRFNVACANNYAH